MDSAWWDHTVTSYATSIHDLGLPARLTNVLLRNDVETMGDLLKHRETDLLRIPALGSGSVQTIKIQLAKRGFTIAGRTL